MKSRRLFLFAAALCAGGFAQAQESMSREATIEYINRVMNKASGALMSDYSGLGQLKFSSATLTYNKNTKTYTMDLVERGVRDFGNGETGYMAQTLSRSNWSFRNLESMQEGQAIVALRGGGDRPNPEVSRIRVTLATKSVRETQDMVVKDSSDRVRINEQYYDRSGNAVSFFFRSGDPDDAKRLKNALLHLKQLDSDEKDPFLN